MNKILLVEDNENFRKMLELNFEKASLAFESCASAEDAFDIFNRDVFSVGVFWNSYQWYTDQPGSGYQGLDRGISGTVSGLRRPRSFTVLSPIHFRYF